MNRDRAIEAWFWCIAIVTVFAAGNWTRIELDRANKERKWMGL